MSRIELKNGIVDDYTIVLSTRDKRHCGQLSGIQDVRFKNHFNSVAEISFSVNEYKFIRYRNELWYDKYLYQKIKRNIWENIVDLKLVWIKELNKYFEIKVSIEESVNGLIKHVTGTHLCEAELSQLLLENIEINTEPDILRDDYKVTTFYNREDEQASLMNRILSDKAPHYSVKYVDESIAKMQRSFSISSTNIYDFLTGECAEQFNCRFVFDSADRSISVYDLLAVCQDCGHRGEDYDKCPECGSTNIKYLGKDTTILVDKDNLTESVQLEVDSDNIKNCFKMIAGDDLMTATVRTLNQNGSDYIYYFSDMQLKDMPKALSERIKEYNALYDSKTKEYQELVEGVTDEEGNVTEKGIFQLTDDILYLQSGMMPTIDNAEVTSKTEADKLTMEHLSPVGLSNVTPSTSIATVNSALKNYAKVYAKSGFVKIEIDEGAQYAYSHEENGIHYGKWSGTFVVTNYSDKEDVTKVTLRDVIVHDDYPTFVKQKVLKQMAQTDDEYTVFDVLGIEDLDEFKEALTLYGKNRLSSFYDAIQSALDVLIQLGQGEKDALLYQDLYTPYYEKLQACQAELDVRQSEIDRVQEELDKKEARRLEIQQELNFKEFLGEYYDIFCSYRREEIYSNDNFISDGLDNAELISRAKEFVETAKKELYKSGEKQINISSTLYNLLLLEEFKPIEKYFELGNWIRVKVDGEIYRLRLLGYTINFSSLQTIDVEFSTASKIRDLVYEAKQIHDSVKSVASSYSYVSKQAEQGSEAQSHIQQWMSSGLSGSLVQLKNSDNEEVIFDQHGLLARAFDDISGTYEPKQLRVTHNTLAFTDNDWQSVRQVIGEHGYVKYNKETNQWESNTGYGMTADFLNAAHVAGSNIVGGEIYSTNYNGEKGKEEGTYIDLDEGSFSFAGGGLTYSKEEGLKIASTAIEQTVSELNIVAETLGILAENIEGQIASKQIESLEASKITGTLLSSQIEQGTIKAGSVDSQNINGQIKSSQIESLDSDKLSGSITSSQIEDTLSNKTVDGTFSGEVNASSVTTTKDGVTYSTFSGDVTIGDTVLTYINGLLVNVTQQVS